MASVSSVEGSGSLVRSRSGAGNCSWDTLSRKRAGAACALAAGGTVLDDALRDAWRCSVPASSRCSPVCRLLAGHVSGPESHRRGRMDAWVPTRSVLDVVGLDEDAAAVWLSGDVR